MLAWLTYGQWIDSPDPTGRGLSPSHARTARSPCARSEHPQLSQDGLFLM